MKLTEKQINFCEEYVANGFKGGLAYKVAYEQDNSNMASSQASKMLRMPHIQDKIFEVEGAYRLVGNKLGINKELIMKRLLSGLNAKKPFYYNGKKVEDIDDYTAINAAITTYAKLTGDFAPEKKQIEIEEGLDKDPSKMTPEERQELTKKILEEI